MNNLSNDRRRTFFSSLMLSLGALCLCAQAHAQVLTVQPIASPPTYLGTAGGQPACATTYRTHGFEPVNSTAPLAKYPLFLYFVGTRFDAADPTAAFDTALAPNAAAAAMAARGFVAVSVEYDNEATIWDVLFGTLRFSTAGFNNKLNCMFGSSNPSSLVAVMCARGNVDCSKGIATWGHSQGAVMGVGAANFDRRVNAAFTTGYSGSGLATRLAYNRIRLVNGELDTGSADVTKMNTVTGVVPAQDCSGSVDQCFRADGSGWKVIRQAELVQNEAGHCWFTALECSGTETLEPNWTPGTAAVFSLATSADWLVGAATQARACPSALIALRTQPGSSGSTYYVSARVSTAGVPVQAVAASVSSTERFACLEKGNGQVILRASNNSYVSIHSTTQQLSAASALGGASAFEVILVGTDSIALKSIATGKYVGANPPAQPGLVADRTSNASTETFTVFPQ